MPRPDSVSEPASGSNRFIALVAVALPMLVLFGPALFSDRLFAMRDAGHYYYPLFKWCADEWGAGRIPLWNPLENCGTAIHADPTASIWYPGKLVFALPLDFSVNYKLYVVGHVVLCAAAAYWLARKWGASQYAAALAALSYSCGGSVVFQHCNVVYLVGAAWLPVAAGLVDDIFRQRRIRSAAWLGAVLALMVLGGDPQMAYHVLLIAGTYAAVLVVRRQADSAAHRQVRRQTILAGGLIVLSTALAFCLAAIQVLPSAEATRDSDRAFSYEPRNVYEASDYLFSDRDLEQLPRRLREVGGGLVLPPVRDSHHATAYEFSVAPWRLAEFIWPSVGGRMYPTHRRWFSLLPEESRIWSPTLYLGLLPLALALSVGSFRSADARVRWLSWVALLFLLGSFGAFGLGWIARQFSGFSGLGAPVFSIGDGVGGVYWLLVVLLPKYVLFRYPAKLLVVASLGVSQLAAIGWDRAIAQRPRWLIVFLTGLGAASAIAGLVSFVAARFIVLGEGAIDPVFGPFDSSGAWTDIISSFFHASIVSLGSAWLLRISTSSDGSRPMWRFGPGALIALCSIELGIANHWLAPTAPAQLWREPSAFAANIHTAAHSGRVWRANSWWPRHFARTISSRRIEEIVRWERDTFAGRYAQLDRVATVNAQNGIIPADYRTLIRLFVDPADGETPTPKLGLVGTEFLLLPNVMDAPFAERVTPPDDAVLRRVLDTQPRVFVPLTIDFVGPRPRNGWQFVLMMVSWNAEHDGTGARVEVEGDLPLGEVPQRDRSGSIPHAAVTYAGQQRVIVQASLPWQGLVVLNDRFDRGWTARVQTQPSVGKGWREESVYRTNDLFRGVYLPAGEHTIEFRYEPPAFYWGAWISAVSWAALLVGVGVWLWRRPVRRAQIAAGES